MKMRIKTLRNYIKFCERRAKEVDGCGPSCSAQMFIDFANDAKQEISILEKAENNTGS